MTRNEVRKVLQDKHINLAWLAKELGISPQALQSRLNAKNVKRGYLLEMVNALNQDIFGVVGETDSRDSFTIQPEALAIIDQYRDRYGHLDFGYKFSYKNFVCYVNNALKEIADTLQLDIGNRICYYSARKSFVQHGFDLGISLEVLEYCIGQTVKSNRPIFNYLKIMRRHADNAMRQIFDALK